MHDSNQTSTRELHWVLKLGILFGVAAIATVVQMAIENRWPQGFQSMAANLLGGTLAFWLVSLVIAGFVRGWSGVIVGILIITIMSIFAGRTALQRRHDKEQMQQMFRNL